MNHRIRNISIAKPCHEDWHNMLPHEQGRFCASCQKAVIDFTCLSNKEIIESLSTVNKVCGRFDEAQLANLNNALALARPRPFFWRRFGLAAAFAGLFPFTGVYAKSFVPTEQRVKRAKSRNLALDHDKIDIKIVGHVADTAHTPLPGATITIIGSDIKTSTDLNGNFSLMVPRNDTLQLKVSFIGFVERKIRIDLTRTDSYNFELAEAQFLGSASIVVGGATVRRSFLQRVYYAVTRPVRRLFK